MAFNLNKFMSTLVWVILFVEGLVSVSLQIIFMRQLIPFTGNDVVIMGMVIGTFLAALALGYYSGGKSEDPLNKLKVNLMLSALWVSVGCSYYAMGLAFSVLVYLESNFLQAILYLIVGMAPIVYMLGQTVPLLTNLIKKSTVAEITGSALSLNTVGSVIGAFVTPVVFFWLFGVGTTVVLNVVFLVVLTFLVAKIEGKSFINWQLIVPVLVLGLAVILNIVAEKSRFIKTTAYANYNVRVEDDGYGSHAKIFELNNTYASAIENGQQVSYIRYLHEFMVDQLGMTNHDVLVLGAGGFTFSLQDETNNQYSYVDIDPAIKDIAEKFFLSQDIKGDFIAEDARYFLKSKRSQYDLVVVDLYSSRTSMPWHVTTKEFVESVSDSLTDSGFAMFNIIEQVGFKNETNHRLRNTINSVFSQCYSIPLVRGSQEYANVVYICKKPNGMPLEVNVDDRQAW